MNYVKKSLKVSLIDAIVVSIFASVFAHREHITVFVSVFLPLFVSFFISSLFIAKSSKREPISVFLYPFLKTDFSALRKLFILSLIAYIVLFYLLLIFLFDRLTVPLRIVFLQEIIFLISFLIIMRIGLIFITRPETSIKGGIIILTIGTIGIGMVVPMMIGAFPLPHPFFWIVSCIVIIISGFLGMKEGDKYYANEILKIKGENGKIRYSNAPFIIPIVSFIFAVAPVLTLVFGFVIGEEVAGLFFFMFLPFAVISTTLNIVGMSKIEGETNPKKKLIEEILIIITWYLIVFSTGGGILLLMVGLALG